MKKWFPAMLVMLGLAQATSATVGGNWMPGNPRFQLCENKAGGGFYWTDTTSGDTWEMHVLQKAWIYRGKPHNKPAEEPGTYMPYANLNGAGMFLLDTSSGEGWFFDGRGWRPIGKPPLPVQE